MALARLNAFLNFISMIKNPGLNSNKAPRLETERLLLREWKASDLQPFAAMGEDPDVMEFFQSHLTLEDTQRFITRANELLRSRKFGLWAAEIKVSGEFIGFIGLSVPSFQASFTPCVEIGWRLKRSAWGHGYAAEGAKRVLRYAFEEIGLKEVVSFTAECNIRSIRVMERIGMAHDRDFDHPNVQRGHRLEKHVLYRIKPSDTRPLPS